MEIGLFCEAKPRSALFSMAVISEAVEFVEKAPESVVRRVRGFVLE
jgi:hypothetical protein